MTLLVPAPLQPQDKIAVIAPSGAIYDGEKVLSGINIWQERGYQVVVPDDLSPNWGYLAGEDRHRCRQFIQAWSDPEIKGLVCARGGYGCMRLLEVLNFSHLRDTPKWLIGFSDITALLWAIATQKQTTTIHAPVLTTLSAEPAWSVEHFFQVLEQPEYHWQLQGLGWGAGKVTGRLWVGNLTVATALIGTRFMPDLAGAILAFEDIYEVPYRLDRLLTQWRLSGLLARIKGIALGRFSHTETELPSLGLAEMLADRLADLGIPVVSDLPFGHEGANPALPVGQIVSLDGDRGLLYSSSGISEELGLADRSGVVG